MKERAFVMFKKYRLVFVAIIVTSVLTTVTVQWVNQYSNAGDVRVIYSLDKRQNDQEIIKLIDNAEKYAYFAVYYFTHRDIAEALIRAKRRGIDVRGITDRVGSEQGTNKKVTDLLRSAGIPLFVQKHRDGIMHIKLLVTDKAYASGSYNWTVAATEANDEVLEIGSNESLRKQYLSIIQKVLTENETATIPTNIPEYDYTEAKEHIGTYAVVSGTVMKVTTTKTGTTFLNFCKTAKNCPFTVVIFKSDSKKFSDVEKFVGKIRITGVIQAYKGQAEVVLKSMDQVEEE